MTEASINHNINNLDQQHFTFWQPPVDHMIHIGPDQQPMPLPQIPLPIKTGDLNDNNPSDNAIGEGVYDYLRQFPYMAKLVQKVFEYEAGKSPDDPLPLADFKEDELYPK